MRKKLISKLISSMLIFALFVPNIAFTANAVEFVTVTKAQDATVIEIVDGDSMLVEFSNKDTALIKLAGIKEPNEDGIKYIKSFIGKSIYVTPEPKLPTVEKFNYTYLYDSATCLNSRMIALSQAKLDETQKTASLYNYFATLQKRAKKSGQGVWTGSLESQLYPSIGNKININTASTEELRLAFKLPNNSLADAIVNYREKHPFQKVTDVKFVSGMTSEIYNKNLFKMVVSTNMKTASEAEVNTLADVTTEEAAKIMTYRARFGFITIDELKKYNLISTKKFNSLKNYISLQDVPELNVSINGFVANINTASKAQLVAAGLTETAAGIVISERSRLPLKSLYDIGAATGLSAAELEALGDNLHVYTDINKATQSEMESILTSVSISYNALVGIMKSRPYNDINAIKSYFSAEKFNKIAPFLYIGKPVTNYVNINTASYEQLMKAGFTEAVAKSAVEKRGQKKPSDIPYSTGLIVAKATLYTDINTASVNELFSLSEKMTPEIVTTIIEFRILEPYGTKAEIEKLFRDKGLSELYNNIGEYIVVR